MELIITNAKIVDGTGNPFYFADIGIRDGRIAQIGRIRDMAGACVIDAGRRAVCPGFIDGHSHSDWMLMQNRRTESSLRQGVTTEVIGNCGISYAPITDRNVDIISAMNRTYQPDVPFRWRTMDDYLTALAEMQTGINTAVLVGHGTLRQAVIGNENRTASDGEIADMAALLRLALDDGAVGLSTGLEYRSGYPTDRRELLALLQVVADKDKIHTSHMRNRDLYFREAAMELLDVTEAAGAALVFSHLTAKPGSRPDDWAWIMERIEQERTRGLNIGADTIPYRVGPGLLYNILPEWMFEGGVGKLVARLRDPEIRARVSQECNHYWLLFSRGEWDKLTLTGSREHPEYAGKTFREISEIMRKPPLECIFDILVDAGEGALFVTINGLLFSEEHITEIVTHPLYGLISDGWSSEVEGVTSQFANHPNCFGWTTRVLSHYVRERHALPLEEAVRKMTSLPARLFKLRDRGVIREQAIADLVIFDDTTITDGATYAQPRRYCDQMFAVIQQGRVVVRDGALCGTAQGQVLRMR